MDCWIWGKGTAAQGATNIVLCLHTYLMKYGILNGTKLKELVIIADNYVVQNENKCVIHYSYWLVGPDGVEVWCCFSW